MHRSNIQLLQRPHLAFRSKSSGGIHTVENSLPSVYRSLCPYRQRHLHKLRHSSQPRFQPAPSHGLRPLRPPMEPAALRAFRFNRFRSRGPCSSLLEHGRGKRAVRRRRWNFRSRGPRPSLLGHGRGKIAMRRRRWNFRFKCKSRSRLLKNREKLSNPGVLPRRRAVWRRLRPGPPFPFRPGKCERVQSSLYAGKSIRREAGGAVLR